MWLLTYEKQLHRVWNQDTLHEKREQLAAEGVRWHWLPYHKRPSLPATTYDIFAGGAYAARLARREGIDVFHGRAHVGAMAGAIAKRLAGGRLIFDIRGLNAEEYVDAGRWREGDLKFRATKRAERAIFSSADGFVVLTERAREILFPGCGGEDSAGRPIEVIPCCVDFGRFRATESVHRRQARQEMGFAGRFVIVYVGGLGNWYMTEEMADFFAAARARRADTFPLILTHSPAEEMAGLLEGAGFGEQDYRIFRACPEEIPSYLNAADLALSFIRPSYSKQASSPTKLAEYLAGGLPIVSSAGIGDMDNIIEGDRVGVLIRNFGPEAYREGLDRAEALLKDPDTVTRCRSTARRRFDVAQIGGPRYARLYERVLGASPADSPQSILPM